MQSNSGSSVKLSWEASLDSSDLYPSPIQAYGVIVRPVRPDMQSSRFAQHPNALVVRTGLPKANSVSKVNRTQGSWRPLTGLDTQVRIDKLTDRVSNAKAVAACALSSALSSVILPQ